MSPSLTSGDTPKPLPHAPGHRVLELIKMAVEMAQYIKAHATTKDGDECDAWDPYKRREPAPTGYPLTSTHAL